MLSALPAPLRELLPEIRSTIESWPIAVPLEKAVSWLLQFDVDDRALALRVLKSLQVIGAHDVTASLKVAHAKLCRRMASRGSALGRTNTLFASIGNTAKSGGFIAYQYRVAAGLPANDFLSGETEEQIDFSKIENVVLVDDLIGSGRTAAKDVQQIAEEVYSLIKTRNVYVLTVGAYDSGIKLIEEQTGAAVVCALEYSSADTVASLDSPFYAGLTMAEREGALAKLKQYNTAISRSELGYDNLGGLLVFEHNTPNTTIPIVWQSGKSWTGLFPRTKAISGAAKVLKVARKQRKKDAEAKSGASIANPLETAVTVFVEGRSDEILMEYLCRNHRLAELVGVLRIEPVAIGGLYQSPRLFELLKESMKHAVLILEGDERTRLMWAKKEAAIPVLYLRPNFMQLLDLNRIYADSARFGELPDSSTKDERWYFQLERAVMKRAFGRPGLNQSTKVLDDYLDPNAYGEFVDELKGLIMGLFEPGREGR